MGIPKEGYSVSNNAYNDNVNILYPGPVDNLVGKKAALDFFPIGEVNTNPCRL